MNPKATRNHVRGETTIKNSSGSMIIFPDGRVEGCVFLSPKREGIFVEVVNQSRVEKPRKANFDERS